MDLMQAFNNKNLKAEPPVAEVGDTVRVHVHIKEGNRERIQVFEGTVIAKKHGGIEETITVRRISYGVGVEKVFPIHAPTIEKIETVRKGKVRRAKLYYLRAEPGRIACFLLGIVGVCAIFVQNKKSKNPLKTIDD